MPRDPDYIAPRLGPAAGVPWTTEVALGSTEVLDSRVPRHPPVGRQVTQTPATCRTCKDQRAPRTARNPEAPSRQEHCRCDSAGSHEAADTANASSWTSNSNLATLFGSWSARQAAIQREVGPRFASRPPVRSRSQFANKTRDLIRRLQAVDFDLLRLDGYTQMLDRQGLERSGAPRRSSLPNSLRSRPSRREAGLGGDGYSAVDEVTGPGALEICPGTWAYCDWRYPWSTVGEFRRKLPNGSYGNLARGSGTLVGPRHVLTARHVLSGYTKQEVTWGPTPEYFPEWISCVQPDPGEDGGSIPTFWAGACPIMSPPALAIADVECMLWLRGGVTPNYPGSPGCHGAYDVAVAILKKPMGQKLGYCAVGSPSVPDVMLDELSLLQCYGYPGNQQIAAILPDQVQFNTPFVDDDIEITKFTKCFDKIDAGYIVPGLSISTTAKIVKGFSGGPLWVPPAIAPAELPQKAELTAACELIGGLVGSNLSCAGECCLWSGSVEEMPMIIGVNSTGQACTKESHAGGPVMVATVAIALALTGDIPWSS